MKKCYAYTRVSTAKQSEGVSLEAQREAIERYASQNGITISKWFEEKETAAKSGRPIFSKVVRDLKRGCARGLVVHKIDRSARNFKDWAIIGDLSDVGIEIHFATESLDFNSRGGRLAADIQAVVAADYIRNLREEAKKGLNMRLEQGLYPFHAPLGYLNTGKGKPKAICPTRGALVREMFELYASGEYSLRSLPEEMNRRGLTTANGGKLYKSLVEQILRNPFYMGVILIRRTGKTYQGVHEPLVSSTTFAKVQAVRSERDNQKSTKHNHLFRGLVRCGACGSYLSGERQKAHVYYRCHSPQCPLVSIREDALQAGFQKVVQKAALRPEHATALSREMGLFLDEKARAGRAHDADLEITKLESRLDRLLDQCLDGAIDQSLFNRKKEAILFDIQHWREIKSKADELGTHKRLMDSFLFWCQDLPHMYELAENEEKRALVKTLTSNRVLNGKKLAIEPSNWVFELERTSRVQQSAQSTSKVRTLVAEILGIAEEFEQFKKRFGRKKDEKTC